jgi:CheY-like chemotaxis protein
MHGGRVSAASPGVGAGSTFTVVLPLAIPLREATAAASVTGPLPAKPRARVLVVDDNQDGAETMAALLGLLGHEVHVAHDGVEAIATAERVRPELVLMDVGLPRLNGLDATRQIREQAWGQAMTIIALTGWGQEGDRVRSQEAGCDGHLVKPVSLADLQRVLAGLPHQKK